MKQSSPVELAEPFIEYWPFTARAKPIQILTIRMIPKKADFKCIIVKLVGGY
jgi:hypothetical protein